MYLIFGALYLSFGCIFEFRRDQYLKKESFWGGAWCVPRPILPTVISGCGMMSSCSASFTRWEVYRDRREPSSGMSRQPGLWYVMCLGSSVYVILRVACKHERVHEHRWSNCEQQVDGVEVPTQGFNVFASVTTSGQAFSCFSALICGNSCSPPPRAMLLWFDARWYCHARRSRVRRRGSCRKPVLPGSLQG